MHVDGLQNGEGMAIAREKGLKVDQVTLKSTFMDAFKHLKKKLQTACNNHYHRDRIHMDTESQPLPPQRRLIIRYTVEHLLQSQRQRSHKLAPPPDHLPFPP